MRESIKQNWPFALGFFLPFFTWLFYLVGVWPGSLSVDSTISLSFAKVFYFDETHSAAYSLLMVFARLFSESPAAIATLQIICLAIANGHAMNSLAILGVKRQWIVLLCFVVALSPLNGFMVSTLWKDVPYSACFYWLLSMLVRLIPSGGKGLDKPRNLFWIAFAAVLLLALRANGFVVGLALCVGLFWLRKYRVHGWKFALTWALLLLLWSSFKFNVLSGPKYSYWASGKSLPLHLLAEAYQKKLLSPEDSNLVEIIKTDNVEYNCRNSASLMFNKPFANVFELHYYFRQLISAWFKLVLSHPQLYLRHLWCGSKFILSPWRTGHLYHINHGIKGDSLDPWNYQYGTGDPPKWIQTPLVKLYHGSRVEPFKTMLWWPGFALWAMIGIVFWLRRRDRLRSWLLLLFPLLGQSLFLALTVPNDHTRYQFPLLVALPFFLGLLGRAKTSVESASEANFAVGSGETPQNIRKIWAILVFFLVVLPLLRNDVWERRIYQDQSNSGRFLRENRPGIDHRQGQIFQDGRSHMLVYTTCFEMAEDRQIVFDYPPKSQPEILLDSVGWGAPIAEAGSVAKGKHHLSISYPQTRHLAEMRISFRDSGELVPFKACID